MFLANLNVADDTKIKKIKCIKVLKGSNNIKIGNIIVGVVKKSKNNKYANDHDIVKAMVIRSRSNFLKKNGIHISFGNNDCIILDKKLNPLGRKINGPICIEIRDMHFYRLNSLCKLII